MPRLQVMVGPDRFNMEPCRVNDTQRPHEIDTEHFTGRVLVRILDAPGAREGEEGREYFKDRSRKFCIQIEGRFKKRWNGDEIHFGSDFDKLVEFPRAPFNAGMRVAKYIDPCTFYEEQPPSKRPYIMSPYIACMNVTCAWPAPSRAHEAVVVLRHTNKSDHSPSRPSSPIIEPEKKGNAHSALVVPKPTHAKPQDGDDDDDEGDDIVPREGLNRKGSKRGSTSAEATSSAAGKQQKKKSSWFGGVFGSGSGHKEERVLKPYWRFVGFNDDPRVRALLEAHHTKLQSKRRSFQPPVRPSSAMSNDSGSQAVSSPSSSMGPGDVQHGIAANHPTLRRLGTSVRGALPRFHGDDPGTPPMHGERGSGDVSPLYSPTLSGGDQFFTAPDPIQHRTKSPLAMEVKHDDAEVGGSKSRNSAEDVPPMPPLARITTDVRNEAERSAKTDGLKEEDFKLADELHRRIKGLGGSRSGSGSEAATPSSPASSGGAWQSKLDDALGPWRFNDPGTDMVEDNAFIFTNDSLSVPKRRKHFANKENREKFTYDPDVVYGASFFTDACDLNTFNLSLGPVSLNIARWFKTMPIRYTLRARDEEPVFCTISFQLVD
ncbi:hypothetical protein BDZ90DRAFT_17654 [Jaminaea rosea]|uniref:Domain of unknown function at the cortex 1 domain-containing protein n=1 Tax=Jaminaea rosea TaxID=1569628 RepID=A0A316UZ40_9BASI|nr:hypothetical protein BDZ90DRAFT_17654 [Jaminaea rosea]PWN30559.1 hypothetical protein BDZ90DRAFT_17654 [Jaminaea rosea]